MKKQIRDSLLNKIAAHYDDGDHKKRIRERQKRLLDHLTRENEGKEPKKFRDDPSEIDEFLKKKKELEEKNHEDVSEVPGTLDSALKFRGVDPTYQPLSDAEIEKNRRILSGLEPYIALDMEDVPDKYYMDPLNPKATLMHKYFGYYRDGKWYPTQFSYLIYYMDIYAPEFGLTSYLDRGNALKVPEGHPYLSGRFHRKPNSIQPFNKEMEERITNDAPALLKALSKSVWNTQIKKDSKGTAYIVPNEPLGSKLHSDANFIYFDPKTNTFTVKGAKQIIPVISSYVPGHAKSERLSYVISSRLKLYPDFRRAIIGFADNIEIIVPKILHNMKIDFESLPASEQEEIRGAIIESIVEVMSGEILRRTK